MSHGFSPGSRFAASSCGAMSGQKSCSFVRSRSRNCPVLTPHAQKNAPAIPSAIPAAKSATVVAIVSVRRGLFRRLETARLRRFVVCFWTVTVTSEVTRALRRRSHLEVRCGHLATIESLQPGAAWRGVPISGWRKAFRRVAERTARALPGRLRGVAQRAESRCRRPAPSARERGEIGQRGGVGMVAKRGESESGNSRDASSRHSERREEPARGRLIDPARWIDPMRGVGRPMFQQIPPRALRALVRSDIRRERLRSEQHDLPGST